MKRLVLLAVILGACSGSGKDDVRVGGGGDDTGADASVSSIAYEPFTAKTRSLGLAGGQFQLSITDTQGSIACGLSQDIHNGPGTMGSQIIVNLTYAAGDPCPLGTYSIHSGCSTQDDGFSPFMAEGCAYYRRWDVQANLLGIRAASAGAIVVSGNDTACTIKTNLSFNGQAFSDTVTLTNGLSAPDPWCR
ncbi:MAG TPA: hypothetical protein VGM90_35135 [Kofleriaceae bacterium]|jgi:hypothetical protein